MLTSSALSTIRNQVRQLVIVEQELLHRLRSHAAQLRTEISRIQPRPVTSVSLVGTDGGNNKVKYDPLFLDVIRVVDSSSNEYLLEAVTANLPIEDLDARQFKEPMTALGRLMHHLEVQSIRDICPVFEEKSGKPRSASWVGEYRGLHEWAVLFHLVRDTTFGTDTIIVRDGPFREKMFKPGIFGRIRKGLAEGLEKQLANNRRRLYLAGVLKKSKLLQKYRLALALEQTFHTRYPCFARIPHEMLKEAFKFGEWIENQGGEEDFVGGEMFAAKFGGGPYDPVWMVDIFETQVRDAARIMSFLLNDSLGGFPVPCYPACLQRAHDAAALVDFDMDILEQMIHGSLRDSLGERGNLIDRLSLQESDPSAGRYL
jgi:hypothetical protein